MVTCPFTNTRKTEVDVVNGPVLDRSQALGGLSTKPLIAIPTAPVQVGEMMGKFPINWLPVKLNRPSPAPPIDTYYMLMIGVGPPGAPAVFHTSNSENTKS